MDGGFRSEEEERKEESQDRMVDWNGMEQYGVGLGWSNIMEKINANANANVSAHKCRYKILRERKTNRESVECRLYEEL